MKKELQSEKIVCEACLDEMPSNEGMNFETEDYVAHFCGIECYAQWKEQAAKEATGNSKGTPNTAE